MSDKNEFKGTKGNWTSKLSTGGVQIVCGVDKNGIVTGHVYTKVDGSEESKANAKLIAAAPEMLEFIQKLNKWATAGCNPTDAELKVWAEQSQLLINKATE